MNTTIITPEYLAADQSSRLLRASITFGCFEVVLVALYITSKVRSCLVQGPDFYLMLATLAFNLGLVAVSFCYVSDGGLGRHLAFVLQHPSWIVSFNKAKMALIYLYIPAVTLPKLAILLLYQQLFKTRAYRYATYAIAAVLIISALSALALSTALCVPFAYNWDKSIVDGHCMNHALLYALISIPNIGTDIAMFVLPLPVIWRLQMTRNQKVGLTFTFLTGSMGVVTATIRLCIFNRYGDDWDFFWSSTDTVMWSVIEPGIYLLTACLPSLRTLFKPLIKNIGLGSRRATPSKSVLSMSSPKVLKGCEPNGSDLELMRKRPAVDSRPSTTHTSNTAMFISQQPKSPWVSEGLSNHPTSVSYYPGHSMKPHKGLDTVTELNSGYDHFFQAATQESDHRGFV